MIDGFCTPTDHLCYGCDDSIDEMIIYVEGVKLNETNPKRFHAQHRLKLNF